MKNLRVTIIRDKTDFSPKLEMCSCLDTTERSGLSHTTALGEDFTIIVAVCLNHGIQNCYIGFISSGRFMQVDKHYKIRTKSQMNYGSKEQVQHVKILLVL